MMRPVLLSDSEAIASIYNDFIHNSIITFEERAVTPGVIAKRIRKVASASLPWLVAESDGEVAGYAYASPWKDRPAYRYSVESSIYVAPAAQGQGLGSLLYEALLADLRRRKFHAVIGGIALPNPASVRLHEKFGFRKVAHFDQVGYKFGRWVDVGYWQLILEGEILSNGL